MKNRATIAISSYHDWLDKKSNACYHEMVNALYQRFRGNYIIPKNLPIEYVNFSLGPEGKFKGISITNNRKISNDLASDIETEINDAVDNLSTFFLLASKNDIKVYEISSIINSIKNFKLC